MVGRTVGSYQVVSKLGEGGMGEVYRARDARLRRDVALKILPPAFAADPDRRARFAREAQVLAALNHPQIAAIYGLEEAGGPDGATALVLELVEGPTLADRIAAGPLPIGEVVQIAAQIIDAMEAAHEKGIVHRDLKPGNIKVTPDDRVKVLDFGLAKALGDQAGTDAMNSPTATSLGSRFGVILGTAAYMSPEQAKGKAVDARTDIWAFGCVLYEMLTGARAFDGDDVADFLVAVMTKEPDWSRLPPATPPRLARLVKRCLKKDPRERLRDIADARADLEPGDDAPGVSQRTSIAPRRSSPVIWLAVGVALGVAVTAAMWFVRASQPVAATSAVPTRFTIPVSDGQELVGLDLSPDGQQIVYVAGSGERAEIYHRSLTGFDARPIPGTEGAEMPFFSPDGQWVGFFASGTLKKVALRGGSPGIVCDAKGVAFGATWLADAIVFSSDPVAGLMRVSPDGGTPEPLTSPNRADGEIGHLSPSALPDGKGLVFSVLSQKGHHLAVLSLATGAWHRLGPSGRFPRYVATGHLLFSEGDDLLAVPFDPARLDITGGSTPVFDNVGNRVEFGRPTVFYAVAPNGTLVYAPNALSRATLVSVDRFGRASPLRDEGAFEYTYPHVSPDGQRVAAGSDDAQIWIYDLQRSTKARLTNEGTNYNPVWSPDGSRIVYSTYLNDAVDLVVRPSDLSAPAAVVAPHGNRKYAVAWTKDDRLIFQEVSPGTGGDIRVLTLASGAVADIVATPAEERSARLSPDGRWIAYMSNDSGRFEVYVRPFDRPGGATPVSTSGGSDPVWSPTDDTLYYTDGRSLVAARVATKGAFSVLSSSRLFDAPYLFFRIAGANYDVTPDGQRFVMVSAPQLGPMQVNVVLNWFDELRAIAPGGR